MFNILSYLHERVTDHVTIKVEFQLKKNSEIKYENRNFSSKYFADKWLDQLKKDYLTIRVENFILHKKHIIESSAKGHKSHPTKKIILEDLRNYNIYAIEKATLQEACYWLRKMEGRFNQVLPNKNNPSYDSSVEELNLLLDFAKAQATPHTNVGA